MAFLIKNESKLLVGIIMAIEWLKLSHDLPQDRRLTSFLIDQKWVWVCLLCVASQAEVRGVVTDNHEDLAIYCGFSNLQDFQFFLYKLKKKGMIEHELAGAITITDWEGFES